MIRVKKSTEIPLSLQASNCKKYDSEDVQRQLYLDHDGKCYLCEQVTGKSFQIEHLKPKAIGYFPEHTYTWSNLFLVCPYCNGRKPNNYNLVNPLENNIEEIIEQRIVFGENKVTFTSNQQTESISQTIELLHKLYNGESKLRKQKEENLYNDHLREINVFLNFINKYKNENLIEFKQAIIDCLHCNKEFLGIKYWIIKDNNMFSEFNDFIVWNKK